MNVTNDPLQQLREIHLPDPVSVWPPAPGWWILFVVVLSAILWAVWWYCRRRDSAYRTARDELASLRAAYAANAQEETLVKGLSTLLRRYSLTVYGRTRVAGLTGSAWLTFLDETGDTQAFTNGTGHVLNSVPYGGQNPVDINPLLDLVEHWLNKNRKGRA